MTKPLLRRGGSDSKDGRSRHSQNHTTSHILIISSVLVSFYALIRCFDVVPDRLQQQGSSSGGLSKPTLSSSSSQTSSATGKAAVLGVLERLLIDAGMDQSALSRSEIAQLEEKIEALYGQVGSSKIVVAGSEDCSLYRSTVPFDQRIVAVAGMFNTGTNLLDNQLRKNIMKLTQPNLWQVPWGKHRMAVVKESHVAPQMAQYDKRYVLPVVVIRHPLAWLQSMCAHSYAATWKHDKAHCPNFVPNHDVDIPKFGQAVTSFPVTVKFDEKDHVTFDSLIHLWNEWYQQYLDVDYPILVVRYEDLVFQPHLVLHEIAQCVGGTVRSPLLYQTKTSKSHGSGTDLIAGIRKTADLDPRGILPDDKDYEYYRQYVDADLIRMFHYNDVRP